MEVPFLDLKAQHRAIRDEIRSLWEDILVSAWFAGGPHVAALEEEFAAACGVAHCVAVASGTAALRCIFRAFDLDPGDEVITAPNTFIATTEAITQAGGRIVFADVDPETYNLDPAKLETVITPETRGIVPVHLYGQPADMDPILEIAERNGLWVVEDAAQAHLAQYKARPCGSMGVAAAFSFYPGKNMGACGEAGAVTTNDAQLADAVRMLRDHGQAAKYHHDVEGYNARCDALQAAALRVKLKHLPQWNEARRAHARQYCELLAGCDVVTLPKVLEDVLPVWHLFVIQVGHRDAVQAALKERGVATGLHYPVPLHLQKAYARLGYAEGAFPVSEAYAKRLLSLPMFPELTEEQVAYVCECLKEAASSRVSK